MKIYTRYIKKSESKSHIPIKNCKSKVSHKVRANRHSYDHLLKLPPELFYQILTNVPLWHHNRIRGACKHLRMLTDANVVHLVRKHLANGAPSSFERALQKAIDQLTCVFVSAGLGTFRPGAMLSLLRQNFYSPFNPCSLDVHEYVYSFFAHIQDTLPAKTFKFGYLLTWMAFLNRKDCAEKLIFKRNIGLSFIQVIYKLQHSWMGILHSTYPNPRSFQFPEDGAFLLVFMCDILIMGLTKQFRKEIVSTDDKLYFFGRNATGKTSCSIRFIVRGDARTLTELEACLETNAWTLRDADDVPYNLSAEIEIQSNEASKMGCSSHHKFKM